MDRWWFQPSFHGAYALLAYELGDDARAARAYRAHFKARAEAARKAGDRSGDQAWQALLREDYGAASTIAQQRLSDDPTDIAALLTLSEVAYQQGDPEEALRVLDSVFQLKPDQIDGLLLSASAHAMARRYGPAIEAMKRALRQGYAEPRLTSFLTILETTGKLADVPRPTRPWSLLSECYRYLRIFDASNARNALAAADEAIRTGDHPDDAWVTRGVIYSKQERRDEELHAFLTAVEINPRNADALWWTGRAYFRRGDLAGFYRFTRAAFQSEPDDLFYGEAFYDLLVEQLGDFPEALAVALRMRQIRPGDVRGAAKLGYVYDRLGEHEQSATYFVEAGRLEPADPRWPEGLGLALRELGRPEEAIAAFRQSITLAPRRPYAHAHLGLLFFWLKRYPESITELQTAVGLAPEEPSILIALCHSYQAVLDFNRGTRCFRAVTAANPNHIVPVPSLPEALTNFYPRPRS